MELLLRHGANPALTNVSGDTALDLALSYSKTDVVMLLGTPPIVSRSKCIRWNARMIGMEVMSQTHPKLPPTQYELRYRPLTDTPDDATVNNATTTRRKGCVPIRGTDGGRKDSWITITHQPTYLRAESGEISQVPPPGWRT